MWTRERHVGFLEKGCDAAPWLYLALYRHRWVTRWNPKRLFPVIADVRVDSSEDIHAHRIGRNSIVPAADRPHS